jgi:LPXTG-site transpeptidase (sortase) family protein
MQFITRIMTATPLAIRVVLLYVLMTPVVMVSYAASHLPPMPYIEQSVAKTHSTQPVLIEGDPSQIEVPSVGISLAIIPGQYDRQTNSWTLTNDKAQFADMTSRPNSISGTTFIYGHNTSPVFAKLAGIKQGDSAYVTTTNGHRFEYIYNGNRIVNPDNTSILNTHANNAQLVLMTCEGILSLTRRVMYFDIRSIS